MTITSDNRRVDHIGDGETLSFSFDFNVDRPSHMKVVVKPVGEDEEELLFATDYRISGLRDDEGGTVDFFLPPSEGATIVLRIYRGFDQPVKFFSGPYHSVKHENTFDELLKKLLTLKEELGRCHKITPTSGAYGETLTESQSELVAEAEEISAEAVAAAEEFLVIDDPIPEDDLSTTRPPSQRAAKEFADVSMSDKIGDKALESEVDSLIVQVEPLDDDTLGGGTPSEISPPSQSSAKSYLDAVAISAGLKIPSLESTIEPSTHFSIDTTVEGVWKGFLPKSGESGLALLYIVANPNPAIGPYKINVRPRGESYPGSELTIFYPDYIWVKTGVASMIQISNSLPGSSSDDSIDVYLRAWMPLDPLS